MPKQLLRACFMTAAISQLPEGAEVAEKIADDWLSAFKLLDGCRYLGHCVEPQMPALVTTGYPRVASKSFPRLHTP